MVPKAVQQYVMAIQALANCTVAYHQSPGGAGQNAFFFNGSSCVLILNLGPLATANAGLSTTLAYTKVGGGGGTMTFSNGILTATT